MAEVGASLTIVKTVTEEDLQLFARLSDDYNPIHFDEEFAQRSYFGRRVAHGFIVASLISGAVTKLIGDGNVLVEQQLKFLRPVGVGETVRLENAIKSIQRRNVYHVESICYNEAEEPVLSGISVCMKVR